jgi:hypothetical protein
VNDTSSEMERQVTEKVIFYACRLFYLKHTVRRRYVVLRSAPHLHGFIPLSPRSARPSP